MNTKNIPNPWRGRIKRAARRLSRAVARAAALLSSGATIDGSGVRAAGRRLDAARRAAPPRGFVQIRAPREKYAIELRSGAYFVSADAEHGGTREQALKFSRRRAAEGFLRRMPWLLVAGGMVVDLDRVPVQISDDA